MKLQEPTIMRVQLLYDDISAQIKTLQQFLDSGDTHITIKGVVYDKEAAQIELNKLLPQQENIEVKYGIKETSTEEQKSVLESYQELAKNGLKFDVVADVTSAKTGINEIVNALAQLKSKTITVTTNVKTNEPNSTKTPGGHTVKALGNAYASGNIGLSHSEKDAIVGELGPEMVVDPIKGTYYTVGDNGTEMVDLPKGAIIYNHKQTAELLKHGYTTRGRYTGGLSFASGNAYADYGIPSYHPNTSANTSFANGDKINNVWDDAASSLSNAADSISNSADEFSEVFDWIAVRLEEIEEKLSLFSAALENSTTYIDKNNIIDDMIDTNQSKLANLKAGYKEYTEYANTLLTKVPAKYRDAVQNGAIAIEQFVGEADESTLEAINNYREWAQKAADVNQQIEEVLTEIRELAIQKIDNIQSYGDAKTNIEKLQTERLQSLVEYLETKGEIPSSVYYGTNGGKNGVSTGMFENAYKQIEYWEPLLADMQKEFDQAVENGQIVVGTSEWYEQ